MRQAERQLLQSLGVERVVAEVEPEAEAEEIRQQRFAGVVAHQGEELHRVVGCAEACCATSPPSLLLARW